MMQKEFEELTGVIVSNSEYASICVSRPPMKCMAVRLSWP